MRIRCAWHKQNFGYPVMIGEKPPLADGNITDGICQKCYEIEDERIKAAAAEKK